jgi:hypothetical protein
MRVSYRHRAIARWLLANPDRALGECAAHFGYSQAWLSIIVNSDAFQALIAQLQDEADDAVIATVPDKLRACADMALDKVLTSVENADVGNPIDREFVRGTADMALHRLGYAPRRDAPPALAPQVQYNTVILADRQLVEQTRQKLLERSAPETEVLVSAALAENE